MDRSKQSPVETTKRQALHSRSTQPHADRDSAEYSSDDVYDISESPLADSDDTFLENDSNATGGAHPSTDDGDNDNDNEDARERQDDRMRIDPREIEPHHGREKHRTP